MIEPCYLEVLDQIDEDGHVDPFAMELFREITADYELYIPFLKNGVTEFLDAVKKTEPNLFYHFMNQYNVLFTLESAGDSEWCKKVRADIEKMKPNASVSLEPS